MCVDFKETIKEVAKGLKVIYFVSDKHNHIKIGFSKDIKSRIKDLNVASPYELELVFAEEGDIKDERKLHKKFSNYCKNGEWFRDCKEIRDYINKRCNENYMDLLYKIEEFEDLKKENQLLKKDINRLLGNNENNNINIQEIKKYNSIINGVIKYLNKKANKSFKTSTRQYRSSIRFWLNRGYIKKDFKIVIDNKVAEWKGQRTREGIEMEKYLRPETLFGKKFESYINEGFQLRSN
jgi:uncharacterized phage protein (TIGR02220 family)